MSSELPIGALGSIMKKFLQKKIEEAISRPVNGVLDSSRKSDRLAEQQRKINIDLLKKNNIEQKKNVNKSQQNKLNNEQKKITIEFQKKTIEQKQQINTEQQIKINLNLQQKSDQKPGVDASLQKKIFDNQNNSANSNSSTRDNLTETNIEANKQQTIPSVVNQVNNQPLANIKIEQKVKFDKQESPIFENSSKLNKTQPPLPQQPPPPDFPLISVKKELMMMDDYNSINVAKREDIVASVQADKTNENRPKMCREFVRGLCSRGAACKYSHVLDVTQLKKVYKFCWDFQNKKCTRKVCKHVHATVFEEQHFYRTGYLPPHVFNKSVNTNVTHQTSPTPSKVSDYQIDLSTFFTEPPPSEPTPIMPSVSTFTPNTNFTRPTEAISAVPSSSISPPKRDWVDMNFSGRPSRDADYSEVTPKKCKKCDPNEMRLQEIKNKAANMSRNSEELNQAMAVLTEKNNLLNKILFAILEQSPSIKRELRKLGNGSPMFNNFN